MTDITGTAVSIATHGFVTEVTTTSNYGAGAIPGNLLSVSTNGVFTNVTSGASVLVVAQTGNVNCVNFPIDTYITAAGTVTPGVAISDAVITLDICNINTGAVLSNLFTKTATLGEREATTLFSLNGNTDIRFKYTSGSYLLRLSLTHPNISTSISYYGFAIGYITPGYIIDHQIVDDGDFTAAFTQLLNTMGKYLYVENGSIPCPNCRVDKVMGRSINKYNTKNTYPLNSDYNRPFSQGQVCSVCGGTSKITQWLKVKGLVNWMTQAPQSIANIQLSSSKVEVKVPKSFIEIVRKAQQIRVERTSGTYITCSIDNQPTGFGITSHNFFVFYATANL